MLNSLPPKDILMLQNIAETNGYSSYSKYLEAKAKEIGLKDYIPNTNKDFNLTKKRKKELEEIVAKAKNNEKREKRKKDFETRLIHQGLENADQYNKAIAERKGFTSYKEYLDNLAKKKGFESHNDYYRSNSMKKKNNPKYQAFSIFLKERLEEQNMTIKYLAHHLGVSYTAVNFYTRGLNIPSEKRLLQIFEIVNSEYKSLDEVVKNYSNKRNS